MRRSASALLAAGLAAVLSAPAAPAAAQNVNIVVPNSLASAEGNANNSYPFNIFAVLGVGGQLRFQQVFGANQFGTHRLLVTHLQFRPDFQQGIDFYSFVDDIQMNLSTTATSPDALSTTFASNVGANDTIVYPRSSLTLSSNFNGPVLGPKNFDIQIPLNTPFVYEPTQGNLLLDVRTYTANADTSILDAVRTTGDAVSRVYAMSATATTGTSDTLGLVVRFRVTKISTLTGSIDLQNATNAGVPITLDFRDRNSNNRFARTIVADSFGNFTIERIPSSDYDIGVKGDKWLRRTVRTDLSAGDVSNFNYTLRGGDVNNDNEVDIDDLLLLIGAFNQSAPAPGYLYAADLNNDGDVDISDLQILISNYNRIGDP
jgi:hypothetical protein